MWSDYTAYSGILKVYKGDAYHDALFKYGSLIATGNDATVTEEKNFVAPTGATTTNDVVWYPGNFNVTVSVAGMMSLISRMRAISHQGIRPNW